MANYFAHDDALEPALAVLCEVLRNAPNIGAVLNNKCQTFLGLAACFQKLRSSEDHDIKMAKPNVQPTDKSAKKPRQPRPARGYPFRPGYVSNFKALLVVKEKIAIILTFALSAARKTTARVDTEITDNGHS